MHPLDIKKHWKVFSRVGQPCHFKFLEGGEILKCNLEPGCHGVITGPLQVSSTQDPIYNYM